MCSQLITVQMYSKLLYLPSNNIVKYYIFYLFNRVIAYLLICVDMNDKVFLIAVELNSISAVQKFEDVLSSIGEWKKIVGNVYVLKQTFSRMSENVRVHISNEFGENSRIFIMKTSLDAAWNLDASVDSWLKSNI